MRKYVCHSLTAPTTEDSDCLVYRQPADRRFHNTTSVDYTRHRGLHCHFYPFVGTHHCALVLCECYALTYHTGPNFSKLMYMHASSIHLSCCAVMFMHASL